MRRGDLARAWRINDAVLAARDARTRDDPSLPYHLRWVWNGESLAGRHVLVRCYHGLGDTVQFARFIPAAARLAASLTVEAPQALCGLLAAFEGVCRIVPFDVAHPLPAGDCDIEIMELAHALRVTALAGEHRADWAAAPAITAGGPLSLGVCWRAGDWDPHRSLPAARLLEAAGIAGARLFSLQRGEGCSELTNRLAAMVENPGARSMDVGDTAALIRRLDIVVTVDSFMAHLAGALGKPAHVLLKKDADWRWMTGGATAWYPRATLFRQQIGGDWDAPLSGLASAIARCRRG